MKLAIFAAMFIVLLAAGIFAAGLEITEIDANVDYDEAYTYRVEGRERKDSASVPVSNNSNIDIDVLPGSNVTFTVRVANTFTGEKPKINGVFVRATIEDIDDGADLEDESLDFDLEPGDDYRYDVKFQIPLDVEANTYNTIVEAEGEDTNGTSYETKVNLKLEVKKQSHDIRITRVLLSPDSVDCDRKAKLTAEITNVGSNPENQIALEFKSGALGVNSYDKDIFLESSDEASEEEKTFAKALNIEVPAFLNAGTYPILINLYWKNFVLFDQKSVDLVVKDCAGTARTPLKAEEPQEEPEQGTEEPVNVITPEEKEIPEGITTATRELSILSSPVLLSMALGAFVIVILFVLIVIGFLRKSRG